MKRILFIDTSSSERICVGIEHAGKTVEKIEREKARAQGVLPMIEELLLEQKLTLSDITEIRVNTGPGSYTGLRVGVAIANMLGKLLGVPINGLPVGQTVSPTYGGDQW